MVCHLEQELASMSNYPAVFTVQEAATYLRLSKATLDRLRVRGGGPAYVQTLTRGKVTYRRVDLDMWLASHIVANTSVALTNKRVV